MRSKTKQQPIAIYDGRADEEKAKNAELKAALEEAKKENEELRNQFLFLCQRINTVHEMYQKELEDASKQKMLAKKASDEAAQRAAELEERIAALEGDVDAAKKENEALRSRSLWQRIFNKGV